ncbi:hypothetical protein [Azospirillum endophyticum]
MGLGKECGTLARLSEGFNSRSSAAHKVCSESSMTVTQVP